MTIYYTHTLFNNLIIARGKYHLKQPKNRYSHLFQVQRRRINPDLPLGKSHYIHVELQENISVNKALFLESRRHEEGLVTIVFLMRHSIRISVFLWLEVNARASNKAFLCTLTHHCWQHLLTRDFALFIPLFYYSCLHFCFLPSYLHMFTPSLCYIVLSNKSICKAFIGKILCTERMVTSDELQLI